jgi:alpha/beta superfamily hydrolase
MVTVTRRDAPAETLEAIYLAPAPGVTRGAILAPPHPLYGGSLDSPVLTELAFACTKAGLGSLRFNWRGVGASAGEPSGGAPEADCDYASALAHLAETLAGPLVAGGYSFGAAAAVRAVAFAPRVDRLLLVAPPPALALPAAIAGTGRRTLVLAGEYDTIAPARELRAAFENVPQVELHVVPHADHFFGEGLSELARLAAAWFEEV